ncbi:hypothetical protein JW935_05985 [candidate division KSB1 bacterium]|nr:hypothetical protein [candidate division KSB1 bacterium]
MKTKKILRFKKKTGKKKNEPPKRVVNESENYGIPIELQVFGYHEILCKRKSKSKRKK